MKTILFLSISAILLLSSCSGPVPNFGEQRVLNKTLVLIEMDSVKLPDNEKSGEIYIKLNSKNGYDGSIIGFGGCNNIFGSFKSTKEDVPEFKLGTTKMYCDDKSVLENKIIEMLDNLVLIEAWKNKDAKYYTASFYSGSPNHRAYFKIME